MKTEELKELIISIHGSEHVGDAQHTKLKIILDQVDRISKGHARYEIARRLSPAGWIEVWELNISTGKPFDEIIDNLRPFTVERIDA